MAVGHFGQVGQGAAGGQAVVGGGLGARLVHAPNRNRLAASAPRAMMQSMFDDGTWILILEALAAGLLLVFIVWWTLPKKHPTDRSSERPQRDPERRD